MLIVAQILAAYVLVDAASGLYHLATDRQWNLAEQIALFEEHHRTNTMAGFDWQTFAVGLPVAVAGAWIHAPFWIAVGIFMALTQVTHYYAHRRSRSVVIHRIVTSLQRLRIIVSPQAHARHHRFPFNRDFCLLSGWNNWWLNGLVRAIEG